MIYEVRFHEKMKAFHNSTTTILQQETTIFHRMIPQQTTAYHHDFTRRKPQQFEGKQTPWQSFENQPQHITMVP